MPYNKDAIDALIAASKLTEAFETLKPVFQSTNISAEIFKILNDIVEAAVKKGDISLAVHAAIYRVGYFRYILVPEGAEWNTIIQAANKAGYFPETSFPSEFLIPKSPCSVAPSELNSLALEIYELFKDKNWDVSGYKVEFSAYGRGPQFGRTTPILLRHVESIKGNDFMLRYSGSQGLVPGERALNDIAGFDSIAVDGVVMEFHSENSTTIYEYSGDKWEDELLKFRYNYHTLTSAWKKVDCRIHGHNEVTIDTLFSSKRDLEEKISGYRRTCMDTKQNYLNKVVRYQYLKHLANHCI